MSKESLAQLIKDEAQLKSDEILATACKRVEEIKHEGDEQISNQNQKLKKEFERKKNILLSSKSAKIDSMKRANDLMVIHHTLETLKKRSAEILLSDSKVRDYLRSWSSRWSDGKLLVGIRISESLPEIIKNAKESNLKVSNQAPDYAIIFSGDGFNEVLDLIDTCGRIVDDNADEFVAILTAS